MNIDKVQISTPNKIDSVFVDIKHSETTSFNDLILNLLNNNISKTNEINQKIDINDIINQLINLINKNCFSTEDELGFNIEKFNLNKGDYKDFSIILSNVDLDKLKNQLSEVYKNKLNKIDDEINFDVKTNDLENKLYEILCFFQQLTNTKNRNIELNTIETNNKNKLNSTYNGFSFTTFENKSLDYTSGQFSSIKENELYNSLQINKNEKIQSKSTFLNLSEVKNLINTIVKKEEISTLKQEFNAIVPRYSFNISNDKNMEQLIFEELEKNVDILKSLDDQSFLDDELPFTEAKLLNESNFINTVKLDNKNSIMSNNNFYQIEKITEIVSLVASKIKSMKNEDIYELKINLKPRELGEINIKLTYNNGNVNGIIIANNKEVANILKENISYLKEQIYNNNYEYKEINLNVQTDNHNNSHSRNKNQNQKKKNHNNKFIVQDE